MIFPRVIMPLLSLGGGHVPVRPPLNTPLYIGICINIGIQYFIVLVWYLVSPTGILKYLSIRYQYWLPTHN